MLIWAVIKFIIAHMPTASLFGIVLVSFEIIVLVFSVVIHEVSHGLMAEKLGDNTARLAGRLTLNPFKHLDLFGSFILPLMLAFFGLPIFGWAKPVPYNPFNLRDPVKGGGLIGAAGPMSNLIVAGFFGLLIRLAPAMGLGMLAPFFGVIVFINILLSIFNLIPIPPLDGSKLFYALAPLNWRPMIASLNRYSFLLLFLIIFWGWQFIVPIVSWLFSLFTGISLGAVSF